MIRQYITVLETQPDAELLRKHQAKSGFRVFHEKNTDLFYLDSPNEESPKTPNFGNGLSYETVLKHNRGYDLKVLNRFNRHLIKTGKLRKHQFDEDIVQDAIFLSDTFQTKVLCAYHDDEDVDCVAISNKGFLERLCFSAASHETNEMGQDFFEVIYTQGKSPELVNEQKNVEGHNSIYKREFKSAYNKPAPDLLLFGQAKPSKDELKAEAQLLGTSQAALRRAYGQFRLVDHEASQANSAIVKLIGFLELSLKIILMPILLIVVFVISVRDDFRHSKK